MSAHGNTPGNVLTIHMTDRHTFKACRRKYKFQVIERLATKEGRADALWIGTGGHYVLANHYQDKLPMLDSWQTYVDSKKEYLDEELDADMRFLLTGYQTHYEEEDDEWEIIEVEKSFQVTVTLSNGESVTLHATIDILARNKRSGRLWIWDHKFLRAVSDAKQLELDDQMTGYIWMLHQYGIPVVGVVYNVIRKKRPTIPGVLKKGGLSKNMSIDTTHEVYLKAIVDNDLDPDDYTEILDKLAKQDNRFFVRIPIFRNSSELKEFGDDLPFELMDMLHAPRYYPSPGQQCNWCQFQILCKAQREGSDITYLTEELFRVRGDDER